MIFLLTKYNKDLDQYIAIIDYETELKVAWLVGDDKVIVLKQGRIIKAFDIPHPFPERFFTDYCLEVSKGNI